MGSISLCFQKILTTDQYQISDFLRVHQILLFMNTLYKNVVRGMWLCMAS